MHRSATIREHESLVESDPRRWAGMNPDPDRQACVKRVPALGANETRDMMIPNLALGRTGNNA